MRRHSNAFNRNESDLLPLRENSTFRKDVSKTSRRNKSSVSWSLGKKSLEQSTIYKVFFKLYLSVIGVFILYHLDLLRSSLFSNTSRFIAVRTDNPKISHANGSRALHENDFLVNTTGEVDMLTLLTTNDINITDPNGGSKLIPERKSSFWRSVKVAPLRFPEDYEKFTVRINTWKREEQLRLSIEHHMTCTAVGQIQIIWCLEQGDPPDWLNNMSFHSHETIENNTSQTEQSSTYYPRIVIERHVNNTLNERFLELEPIPTAGVLSIDDDVIRPCISLHSAFMRWTMNPDRQVGFDARSHEIDTIGHDNLSHSERWSYSYMSTTEKSNKYSITLTRFSFQHRDYLKSYWVDIPAPVRDLVAENFECEDIAMSLWISANTGGRPPLLADYWAVKSQIKIYVPVKISGGKNHKEIRNHCFDFFADIFQLKGRLHHASLLHRQDNHKGYFEYGAPADDWNEFNGNILPLYKETGEVISRWKQKGNQVLMRELSGLMEEASMQIFRHGLLENTQLWKDRFQPEVKR